MRIRLRNPSRELDLPGGRAAHLVIDDLGFSPQTVLVVRNGELVAGDTLLEEGDDVEIRPVISGGAA